MPYPNLNFRARLLKLERWARLVSPPLALTLTKQVKDAVKRSAASSDLGKTPITLLSVGAANVAYWGVKNPSEILKVRYLVITPRRRSTSDRVCRCSPLPTAYCLPPTTYYSQVRRQAGVTNDTLGAAADLWRDEGLGGFYNSYGSNYAYSTPVDAIKFLLYEQLKGQFKARRQGGSLTPVEAAIGGAIAASTAQAIATPLDVARVRIMTSDATGVVDTIRDIADNEGGGALYAGIAPKVVRALASGAIQFSTYEATKEWSLSFLARRFPGL